MTAPPGPFTLAIIAGGQSRRMGTDKAFVDLGGTSLIERVIQRSADLGQAETILITNKPATTRIWACRCTAISCRNKGSLGGYYTALVKATSRLCWSWLAICPSSYRVVAFHAHAVDAAIDIVVPRVDGYPQALHATIKRPASRHPRAA